MNPYRLQNILPKLAGTLFLAAQFFAVSYAQVPPANDDFADAELLATDIIWQGTNQDATAQPGEPRHANVTTGASIWFQWTAPQDGYFTADTFESDYDTVLALYTGDAVDALETIAANDDRFGLQSQIADVAVTQGTVYHLVVDGYRSAQGNVLLTVSFFDGVDVTPPTIAVTRPLEGFTYVDNAVVYAAYVCTDETLGTGVDTCIGDVEFGLPVDTATTGAHTFTVTATDMAGNVGSTTVTYMVGGDDVTAPYVWLASPANNATYAVDASITADYGCTDEPSGTGVATCIGTVPSGEPLDTSVEGSFTFTVTGIDHAGNTASVVYDYFIAETSANDNFASAVMLDQNGTWTGSNVGATVESGEPSHVALASNASIWFQWTALGDGYITVDTYGSNFNTALAMYTGSSVNALTFVAANNDSAGQQSQIQNIPVSAGVTYHIAVDGYFGSTGVVTLNWSWAEQFDFEPPVVTLWSPINGSVLPQGELLWAGYSCYDPAPSSGLISCEADTANGTLIDTSVPGDYSFTVTAADDAGNVTVRNSDYSVVANPPNDDFADAITLTTDGTMSGTNAGGTEEIGEWFHAGSVGGASVWFNWTAPADGFLSADTFGSDFDTLLAIYSGSAVDALTEVDSNDDAVGAQSAVHNAPVSAGVTYSIVVSGAWGDTGLYTLNWSFQVLNDLTAPAVAIVSPRDGGLYFAGTTVYADYYCTDETLGSGVASCTGNVATSTPIDTLAPGPRVFTVTGTDQAGNVAIATVAYTVLAFTNDDFANALPIDGSGSVIATNVGATKQIAEPDHAGDPGGASVWFSWSASTDGFLTVDTFFSDFDTTLAVYTGASVDTLTELGANNDSLGQQSRLQDLPVTAGEIYYIAVDGAGGATGQIDLDWVEFNGPTFAEISPITDPLWVTDADHDFWLNAAAPADIDGDGDLDLAVIGFFVEYNAGVDDRLVVFINDGPGADGNWLFSTQSVPLNGLITRESDLAWGDFDNDGDPDLAVAGEGATELYRNDAGILVPIDTQLPGYHEDSAYSNAYDLRSLTWADYDNDGDLDLLIPSTFNEATFTYGTALMRNDGSDGLGGWTFTEADALIDGAVNAQTAWADDDGDGDLDLFITNVDNFTANGFVRTYRNNNGVFASAEPIGNLTVEYGLGDWSDYDADGDLDILIVGLIQDTDGQYKTLLRIYENINGVFQPNTLVQSSFFPWLDLHAATWADYDSDGDVDILLTGSVIGEDDIEGKSEILVNDGGNFVPLGRSLPAPIDSSGRGGSFTWFDVDGDSDLDYFVAGAYWVPNGNNLIEAQMHLYRNDALSPNTAPAAPTNLSASTEGDSVALSWDIATDDATASNAITYELEILPQSQGHAGLASHRRLPEPGNVSTATSWSLHGLAAGSYTWRVSAVDTAFNGSIAAVASFTIGGTGDVDTDGVADNEDNCILHANPLQDDSDADGFGNRCDPDYNNDGFVNFADLSVMQDAFFTTNRLVDLDGVGTVNFLDLEIMKAFFFSAPGPSALSGAD